MTWLAPLAFLGLAAVAVPILVHLFGRPRARLIRFPTLRFIELTRDAPRRRAVPADLLLLAIRIGIVVVAVLALAQPAWPGLGARGGDAGMVRVILVDTSVSLQRTGPGVVSGVVAARAEAERLAAESGEVLVAETGWPSLGMPGASEWLLARPGTREVVVISDFQPGVLVPDDTLRLAPGIGLRLVRVDAVADSQPAGPRATRVGESVRAEWPAARRREQGAVAIVAGEADQAAAAAVANLIGGGAEPAGRRVSIVLPGAPGRDAVVASLRAPTQPWQGDLLVRLSRDQGVSRLHAGDGGASVSGAVPLGAGSAAVAGVVGDSVIAILPAAGADPVTWAVLAEAAVRALAPEADLSERDLAVLPDESLRAMERAAVASGPQPAGGTASRWLWGAVLALLALEWMVRRRPATRAVMATAGRAGERAA